MERLRVRPGGVLSALAIGAAILLLTGFLAEQLRTSELYSRSRFLSVVLSEGAVGLRDLASDLGNVEMLIQFVGAVTAAYIEFELIPVGEADTFGAVFESRPPSVTISRFAYHGKNLSIFGSADSTEGCDEFVRLLTETDYFESVSCTHDSEEEGGAAFEIVAVSRYGTGALTAKV